jgi:hypothetical protein
MTKKIIIIALAFISYGIAAQAQDKKPAPAPASAVPGNMAAFKWETTVYDFGKIAKNKPVTAEFKFTNSGKVPLTLSNVQASCGCTTPDWTKEPVAPGKSGFIKATYNAAATGPFSKSVTITANVESGQQILTIKGEVVE